MFSTKSIAWKDCGKSLDERLSKTGHTKGVEASIKRHPWVVSIQTSEGKLRCGGSIAASNRIVTAAHCFTENKKKMSKDRIESFKVE